MIHEDNNRKVARVLADRHLKLNVLMREHLCENKPRKKKKRSKRKSKNKKK